MTTVKVSIPFDSLVDSVSELAWEEKLRLWEVLEEQLALAEEEAFETNPKVKAEIQEARTAYEAGDYVTLEEYATETQA